MFNFDYVYFREEVEEYDFEEYKQALIDCQDEKYLNSVKSYGEEYADNLLYDEMTFSNYEYVCEMMNNLEKDMIDRDSDYLIIKQYDELNDFSYYRMLTFKQFSDLMQRQTFHDVYINYDTNELIFYLHEGNGNGTSLSVRIVTADEQEFINGLSETELKNGRYFIDLFENAFPPSFTGDLVTEPKTLAIA